MVLPEILDMNAAEALRAEFLSRRHTPVALDAANVQRLGGLCLQVILSAATTWAKDGCAFQIVNVSSAFEENARVMGAWDASAGAAS